ncbi:MAG: hypothetical protein ACI36Y_05920 [Coriobacteriales bacterium]
MRLKNALASMLSLALAASLSPLCASAWAQAPASETGLASQAAAGTGNAQAEARASRLYQNLAERYIGSSGALDNNDDAAVLAFGVELDYTRVLRELDAYLESPSPWCGRVAKYLTMLSATNFASCEPEKVAPYVQKLDELLDAQATSVSSYDLVWVVPALALLGGSAECLDWAVERLLGFQDESGYFGGVTNPVTGANLLIPDAQTTAQAALMLRTCDYNAILSDEARASASAARNKAIQALLGTQHSDGGWQYECGKGAGDVDTTGWVLATLLFRATDIDYAFSIYDAERFLVSKADEGLDGYRSYRLSGNEQLAAGAASLGLNCIFSYPGHLPVLDEENLAFAGKTAVFNKKSQAPSVSMSTPWGPLQDGVDYTAERSTYKKVGTYAYEVAVTVDPSSGYTGAFNTSCTFKIKPAQVRAVKASKSGGKLKVSWNTAANKGSGITGYKIAVKRGSKVVASTTATSGGYKASSAKLAVPASCKGKKLTVSVSAYKGKLTGAAGTAEVSF